MREQAGTRRRRILTGTLPEPAAQALLCSAGGPGLVPIGEVIGRRSDLHLLRRDASVRATAAARDIVDYPINKIEEADMTPEQQDIVQTSFAKVAPIADTAAILFYEDLFRRDPRLRSLFKEDMTEQRQKLMGMLGTAVANSRQLEKVEAAVEALGRRHAGYGVKMADYDTVGAALIATLEKGLGDDFTPEVRDAWLAFYTVVAGKMLAGAASAAPG
ncbi:MAG TPA: globin family protein [Acetobacteraceae bacterium]